MQREQAEKLVQLFFQTAPPFRRNYIRPAERPEGAPHLPRLPHHHLFCLLILQKNGQTNMSALAERLGVSGQQCTRIVGELVGGGLAERSADEKNRRIVCVSVTDKGKELLSQLYRHACEHIGKQLAALSDEDADELIAHLSGIIKILDKLE